MPSSPYASPFLRKAPLLLASALVAAMLTSCASSDGRLVSAVPAGVDLSGEWRLNENLSDDPQHIDEPKDLPPQAPAPSHSPGGFGRPGTNGPGMPNGPGGIDPGGNGPGGEDISRAAAPATGFVPVRYDQGNPLPSSSSDSGPPAKPSGGHGSAVGHMLEAPQRLTIVQTGGKLVVKSDSDGTSEEFTAGEQRTIPFGTTEADRTSGWRDAAFVVVTKARKGPSKEDDFALDSDGHLIFATLVTHVKKGPIDFKRVYDRVRASH